MPHPAQTVRNYRAIFDYTQARAASEHGVSVRTWQRWESDGPPLWFEKVMVKAVRYSCPKLLHRVQSR